MLYFYFIKYISEQIVTGISIIKKNLQPDFC